MSRLEGGLHRLKADSSARADNQDCRHGVMLPVGPAWLTVMCDAGNRIARWAGGLKRVSKAAEVARRASYVAAKQERCSSMTNSAQECLLRSLALDPSCICPTPQLKRE
jgi:hypothetical protein